MKKSYYKNLKYLNNVYTKAAHKHGAGNKAVLWNDEQTQYFRFSELVSNLNLNDKSKKILDLGCGNAELYKFLNFAGFRGHYVGFDVNKALVGQALRRFKDIDVRVVDIMKDSPVECFNYVVMSGIFNIGIGEEGEWVYPFLKKVFRRCTEIMAFNMISTHVNYREKTMSYFDPSKVLAFCIKNLSRRVSVRHHNLPYNFTVTVFRDDAWGSANK